MNTFPSIRRSEERKRKKACLPCNARHFLRLPCTVNNLSHNHRRSTPSGIFTSSGFSLSNTQHPNTRKTVYSQFLSSSDICSRSRSIPSVEMSPIITFHGERDRPPPFQPSAYSQADHNPGTTNTSTPTSPSDVSPLSSIPTSGSARELTEECPAETEAVMLPSYSKDPHLIPNSSPAERLSTSDRPLSKKSKMSRRLSASQRSHDGSRDIDSDINRKKQVDHDGDEDDRLDEDRYGDEGQGLLYEMSVFDPDGQGRSRAERREPKESLRNRWTRGERIIRGQTAGPFGFERPSRAGWREIKELMYESTPTLLLTLLGLVFTGALLEHLSRWKVFERVDELFILVPMLANLKGNLEMCLGARLSTSANIGELDSRIVRRSLILGQLSLLQVQAIAIASIAGLVSFLLGLAMPHRVSADDISLAYNQSMMANRSIFAPETPRNLAVAAGLWLGERDDPDLGYIDSFKEGYTPPGGKELVMVLVTGIGAACLSGASLGGFMSGLVLLSRRLRINPDNICTPIASCLSDLVTLFILAVIGSLIVPYISTPLPLMILPIIFLAGIVFVWITLKNEYVSDSINAGWTPLLAAVTISSATGVVLDRCVDRYEGFAILAVAMTGLSGAVGSIHASRLSTVLHFSEPSSRSSPDDTIVESVSPRTIALTLFVVSIPVLIIFILAVALAGWMRVEWQLICSFFVVAELTIIISLYLADRFTLCFWSRNLDPDSHTLPILSSMIDLVGQLLLFVAFEVAAMTGGNVRVMDPSAVAAAFNTTSSAGAASTTAAAAMLSLLPTAVATATATAGVSYS